MALRALVGVKRVIDHAAKVYVHPNKRGMIKEGQKHSINPFCEIAVEAAVRLKEQNVIKEIIAVSVGCDRAKEQLHTVLALGADKALLIRTELEPDQTLQPLAVAKLFKSIIDKEKPNIVFLGKQAIDADSNQVGQLLAGLLGWPQITFCSDLELQCNREGYVAIGTREVDQGLQKVRAPLPLVITCDLRMNQPRFVSLPNLIKARKKTIKLLDAQELGVDISPRLQILRVEEPPERKRGVRVHSVDELLQNLRTQCGVDL
ncbi:electron transfer flavoprotein subunit beta [Cyclospora cayetanensis]|uniref:Electron transfer flavoprotein subunit beta n=1 Tax=Cyclospora cayetanensis TaxID=88456 RepID=A0A6P6RVL2_9EIME|nr:electron transfer flavoprotein subunit beta [Cyclospora cayetanensis]